VERGDCRDSAGADAQSVGLRLRGIVVEKETTLPVAGVEVSMVGADARAVTDDRGEFSLERAAPGTMVLLFRRLGYRAGSLTVDRLANDTTTIRFAMERVAQRLSEVDVCA
jgi:hypothetical protein